MRWLFHSVYIYQNITLHFLNIHNFYLAIYINKAEKQKYICTRWGNFSLIYNYIFKWKVKIHLRHIFKYHVTWILLIGQTLKFPSAILSYSLPRIHNFVEQFKETIPREAEFLPSIRKRIKIVPNQWWYFHSFFKDFFHLCLQQNNKKGTEISHKTQGQLGCLLCYLFKII